MPPRAMLAERPGPVSRVLARCGMLPVTGRAPVAPLIRDQGGCIVRTRLVRGLALALVVSALTATLTVPAAAAQAPPAPPPPPLPVGLAGRDGGTVTLLQRCITSTTAGRSIAINVATFSQTATAGSTSPGGRSIVTNVATLSQTDTAGSTYLGGRSILTNVATLSQVCAARADGR